MATIVWDRDDVLVDLTHAWLEQWWRPAHPHCRVEYEALTENPPHRLLRVELGEYLSSLDAFRESSQAAALPPVPEVLAWFEQHGHKHRHMVLTGTALTAAAASAEWTFRHFGTWIESFHLVPAVRGAANPRWAVDKGDYLHWLGKGDLLVDDVPANLVAASRYGIIGVLMPRPWNRRSGSLRDTLDELTYNVERTT